MKYVGIQSQIWKNNINSVLMLFAFPLLLLGMVYLFLFFAVNKEMETTPESIFVQAAPFIILGTIVWFMVAWLFHSSIIRMATASRPLERMENKRVYNPGCGTGTRPTTERQTSNKPLVPISDPKKRAPKPANRTGPHSRRVTLR